MNFYPFHIGDYASATQHLTDLEDLAYRRMMDVYYVSERPLPLDRRQLYRLLRANSEAMREAVDVVIAEFFTEGPDGWRHRRCDAEIERARAKSEKAKANGKLGGEAKAKRSLDSELANATDEPSKGLAPNPNTNTNKEDDGRIARATPANQELFRRVELALKAIPELDGHPVAVNSVIAPIFRLAVDHGLDLETQIVPSIRRQALNSRRPLKVWNYFVDGILADAALPATPPGVHNGQSPRRRQSASQDLADAFDRVKAHVAGRDPVS